MKRLFVANTVVEGLASLTVAVNPTIIFSNLSGIGFTVAYCWALAIACISIVTAFAAYNGSKSIEVLLLITLYHIGFMLLGITLHLNGFKLIGPHIASEDANLFGLLLVHGAFGIACIRQLFQGNTTKSKEKQ